MAENYDCPECEGTGTVGAILGHQAPCDATGEDDRGEWYCIDGIRSTPGFCCTQCGTTDTGRFNAGHSVCIDCLDQHDAERERASLAEEADDRATWEVPEWSVTTINAVADLASTAKKIARLEEQLEQAKADRDHMIARALEEGASVRTVAKVAGVGKSRVDQIRHGTN